MQAFTLESSVRHQSIEIEEGRTIVVGRAPDCELAVLDPTISRRHAEVSVAGDGVTIRDLSSSNGTFVNGKRITEAVATHGDGVTFGRIDFVILKAQLPSTPTPVAQAVDAADASIVRKVPMAPATLLLGHDDTTTSRSDRRAQDTPDAGESDRLPLLLDISRELARQTGIRQVLERIVNIAFQVTDVDSVSLLLVDSETGDLVPEISKSRLGDDAGYQHVPQSITRRVVNERIAVLTDNAPADVRFDGPSIVMHRVRSAMSAPLMGRDGTALGVFYVDNRTATRSFDDDDLQFLITFSGIAATAIESSRSLERVRDEALVRANLARHFAPDLTDWLTTRNITAHLKSELVPIVAVSAELAGLGSAVRGWEPDVVAELLARFVRETASAVFARGGSITRGGGGTLLASWGAPFPQDDGADRALGAAMEMRQRLGSLEHGPAGERSSIGVRIGMSAGDAVACNTGAERKPEYVVVGTPVDWARQLSARAKAGEILLTEQVLGALATPPPTETVEPLASQGASAVTPVYRLSE